VVKTPEMSLFGDVYSVGLPKAPGLKITQTNLVKTTKLPCYTTKIPF